MQKRTLRAKLRAATAAIHEDLHRHPVFSTLADGTIRPGEEADLLARMAEFYAVYDADIASAVARYPELVQDYRYLPRAPRLVAVAPRAPTPSAKASGVIRVPIDGPAALAGVLYVVDGALLGGVTMRPPAMADGLPDYWAWCRSDGPAIWRATCALLARVEPGAEPERRAIGAAQRTFAAFRDWMAPLACVPHDL